MIEPSRGLAPLGDGRATVLILGSLPGQESLRRQQYYAHPRNAFWPIMQALFGINGDYAERCRGLVAAGIAVWDVLASSVRPGSLDAAIDLDSARGNAFPAFFRDHPQVGIVAFNGRKSASLYRRYGGGHDERVRFVQLPSTSPAHAAMPFADKLAAWRQGLNAATRSVDEA